ncbi:DUF5011 domain-containing protein [Listeria booriae]|uniref:DUF5011 domain-containing protein n=1 Tax=Listeria booriae TaxID=1552123 RepID=A0A842AZ20_9LIST|nr:immunoglobulin-like domain-containing protein [Listeria booriae]MBC1795767.1 DUF5011 domain-containing protein [Listeria booriae]
MKKMTLVKVSAIALLSLSLLPNSGNYPTLLKNMSTVKASAATSPIQQTGADVLTGSKFTFEFLGISDWNFSNFNIDIPNEKGTLEQFAGRPHPYFSDPYAEVIIKDASGNQVYKKSMIGTVDAAASTDNFTIKVGYQVTVTHQEASFRSILTNGSGTTFPAPTRNTNVYTVTANGLVPEHADLTITPTSVPNSIKKDKESTFSYSVNNDGPITSTNGIFHVIIPPNVTYKPNSITANFAPVNATYNSTTRELTFPLSNFISGDGAYVQFIVTGTTPATAIPIKVTTTQQDEGDTSSTYTSQSPITYFDVLNNTIPKITVTNKEFPVGTIFDPKKEVTAFDNEDGDITSKIVVESSTVNTAVAGFYSVKYAITDSDGNKVTKTIAVTVTAKTPPVITGDTTTKLNPNATFNPLSTMQASDAEDGNLTNKINITSNDVDTSHPGTYHIIYSVTDSDNMTTTFTRTVIVTEAPVLTGDTETTINLHDSFDPLSTMRATDKEDGNITNQIQVAGTVDTATPGDYTLTYTVTDSDGNKATFTRTVTVYDNTFFGFHDQPDDLLFRTTAIGSNDVTIPRADPNWHIQVEDTRHNGNSWTLTGTVNGPFVNTEDPTAKQLHNALTYTKNGEKTRIQDNEMFQIGSGVSGEDTITTIQSPADEGIQMDINPTGIKAGDNYKTSITWTLSDTPD